MIIQIGQDPHRFVEDLLERVRDLIVLGSVGQAAKKVLRDVPADQLERMRLQVEKFGRAELNYAAEVIAEGLTRMSGATRAAWSLESRTGRFVFRCLISKTWRKMRELSLGSSRLIALLISTKE